MEFPLKLNRVFRSKSLVARGPQIRNLVPHSQIGVAGLSSVREDDLISPPPLPPLAFIKLIQKGETVTQRLMR